jgi:hypothetical protein
VKSVCEEDDERSHAEEHSDDHDCQIAGVTQVERIRPILTARRRALLSPILTNESPPPDCPKHASEDEKDETNPVHSG